MSDLYLSYEFPRKDSKCGLSIALLDPFEKSSADRLRNLHNAVKEWAEAHSGITVISDLGDRPHAHCIEVPLRDYLYADGSLNAARFARDMDMLLEQGKIHRYSIRPGAPAEGLDLVGREDVIRKIDNHLSKNKSCHLRAPRRYGKTSVLNRVRLDLGNNGAPSILVDLSSGKTAVWFFVTVTLAAMDQAACRKVLLDQKELKTWPSPGADPSLKHDAGRALSKKIAEEKVWNFGRRLFEKLSGVGAILLLDEFSVFLRATVLEKPDEAKKLCQMLYEFRTAKPPVRQVLCGSSGLSSYIGFHDLKKEFSDLQTVELPPLSGSDGKMLIEELLYKIDLLPSPELVNAIARETGKPIPYFLHAFIDAINQEKNSTTKKVDKKTIRKAYRDRMMGPMGNFWFRIYGINTQPYPPELKRAAAAILTELAKNPKGVEEKKLRLVFKKSTEPGEKRFDLLLSCLMEDYDIVKQTDCWVMNCKVLRDRWALSEAWLIEGE